METDASDGIAAGVLHQRQEDGEWHPIGFYSKTLDDAQVRYEIHDKEMLALILGTREWKAELIGLKTSATFVTDHRALEYFMTKQRLNSRQARWMDDLSPLQFRITYRPGTDNVVADSLSRQGEDVRNQAERKEKARWQTLIRPEQVVTILAPVTPLPTEKELAGVDLIDAILRENRVAEGPERQHALEGKDGWALEGTKVTRHGRLWVPPTKPELRTWLIREVHARPAGGHCGRRKMLEQLQLTYHWRGLSKDVAQYKAACKICGRTRTWRDRAPGLLQPLPIPDRPWRHISMDFKEMREDAQGFNNVFMVVCRMSKRAISIPCKKTVTGADAARLFRDHVWRYFGPPDTVTSDRGPQFISAYWDEFCKILGIKMKLSTARHPQTDGNTEIVNQYFEKRLLPFLNKHKDNWGELIACADYQQLTTVHETTGMSPIELEMCYRPRTQWDWKEVDPTLPTRERLTREEAQAWMRLHEENWDRARANTAKAQDRQRRQANKHRRPVDWDVEDLVFVSTKGWPVHGTYPNAGPFRVTEKVGHSWKVEVPSHWKVHNVFPSDRLRKYDGIPLPGQDEAPEEPEEVNGEPEWTVAEVLDSRVTRGGRLEYQVAWEGCDPDDEWYAARGFKNSTGCLRRFHDKYPNKPGPSKRLQQWIEAAAEDRFDEDHEEDDAPARPKVKRPRREGG
jgi:transposase InsO family protein